MRSRIRGRMWMNMRCVARDQYERAGQCSHTAEVNPIPRHLLGKRDVEALYLGGAEYDYRVHSLVRVIHLRKFGLIVLISSIPSKRLDRSETAECELVKGTSSFVLDRNHKSYKHQFANLYFARLTLLKSIVEAQAQKRWRSAKGGFVQGYELDSSLLIYVLKGPHL